MELLISLPTVVADKLHDLSRQQLRPIALQAEYMLIRAVQQARLKAHQQPDSPAVEVAHAPAP